RTNRERMLAGDLYIADDPENERLAQRAVAPQEEARRVAAPDLTKVFPILQPLLGLVGAGAVRQPALFLDYADPTHGGARGVARDNPVCLDVAQVRIGEECQLGPNVQLLTPSSPVDPVMRRDKLEAAGPISIGDNVWLGGGVIVGPGVTIGDNTVVGAGSVVVKDLPANVVAVGNPARVVREIGDEG